ncbi:unnamed protein product, partial [Polarella glacialis]
FGVEDAEGVPLFELVQPAWSKDAPAAQDLEQQRKQQQQQHQQQQPAAQDSEQKPRQDVSEFRNQTPPPRRRRSDEAAGTDKKLLTPQPVARPASKIILASAATTSTIITTTKTAATPTTAAAVALAAKTGAAALAAAKAVAEQAVESKRANASVAASLQLQLIDMVRAQPEHLRSPIGTPSNASQATSPSHVLPPVLPPPNSPVLLPAPVQEHWASSGEAMWAALDEEPLHAEAHQQQLQQIQLDGWHPDGNFSAGWEQQTPAADLFAAGFHAAAAAYAAYAVEEAHRHGRVEGFALSQQPQFHEWQQQDWQQELQQQQQQHQELPQYNEWQQELPQYNEWQQELQVQGHWDSQNWLHAEFQLQLQQQQQQQQPQHQHQWPEQLSAATILGSKPEPVRLLVCPNHVIQNTDHTKQQQATHNKL